MTKVESIMLCERIQEEIEKENWQMARTWVNMLSAMISQYEQSSSELANKAQGVYETVPIDNKQNNTE